MNRSSYRLLSIAITSMLAHGTSVAIAQSPFDLLKKATDVATQNAPQNSRKSTSTSTSTAAESPIQPSGDRETGASNRGAESAIAATALSANPASASAMQDPSVSMVFTRSKARSWADAKKNAVTQVKDGESLWIFVKTERALKEYVAHNPDQPDSRTQLDLKVAPKGALTSLDQRVRTPDTTWPLKPEELEGTEFTVSLSPANGRYFRRAGAINASSERATFFLRHVGGDQVSRGMWDLEVFVIGNRPHVLATGEKTSMLRAVPMAVAAITVNVPDGMAKFRALREEDCSVIPPVKKPCKVVD